MEVKINGKNALVGEIRREASEDNLGQTLSFEALALYDVGDKVKVYEGKSLKYSGMIVEVNENKIPPYSYKVLDYSFNLQSEEHMQVKDRVDNVIKNVCKKFEIPCKVCSIPTKIKKIYPDTALSEIFKDMLEIAGKEQKKDYYLRVDCGILIVDEKEKEKVNIPFQISDEGTVTKSIEDRKNSVKIVSNKEKSTKVYSIEKDENSIKKYGLLQVVESIDAEKSSQAITMAKNRLESLNKTTYEKPVKIFTYESAAWDIKPNQLIKIDGTWRKIRSLTHTVKDNIHMLDLSLRWKK